MLHRIVMDVIHMPAPILLIANCMFPKSALPYHAFVARIGSGADLARSGLLDFTPARGIIGIAFRHAPDTVQMFGQDNHRINLEGTSCHHLAECLPQHFDAVFIGENRNTIVGDNGKEINAAGEVSPAIVAHATSFFMNRLVDALRLSTNISAHRQHQRDQQHAPVETEQIEGGGGGDSFFITKL